MTALTELWGLTFLTSWLGPVVNELWEGPAPLTAAPLAGGAAIRSGARSGSGLWSPPAQFPTRLGYGDRRHDAFQLPSLLSPNPLRSARPIYRS